METIDCFMKKGLAERDVNEITINGGTLISRLEEDEKMGKSKTIYLHSNNET
jgi:hypothetical protein